MEPTWWELLPRPTIEALIRRFHASANVSKARPDAILTDDGISSEPWHVIRRYGVND